MNIIIFSHHLSTWAGSETVCLELFDALHSRGHSVRLVCPFASPQFVHAATGNWTVLLKNLGQYDAPTIDLVLVLHQGLSSLGEAEFEKLFLMRHRPFFAYFHLSPYEPFELPGPFVERALADVVYANSEETKQELALHGFGDVEVFPNPAPAKFAIAQSPTGNLNTLLSVSNHVPPELSDAFELLQADGVDVVRVGAPEENRRIIPDDLRMCDALVTIGKTVQYGFRSRRPVFCYDRFQGPGWLAPWTQEEEHLNFSGRSAQTRLSAEQIADEIRQGFPKAYQWVQENDTADLSRFHLETFVDTLLRRAQPDSNDRVWPEWTKSGQWKQNFRTERMLYSLVDRGYAQTTKAVLPRGKVASVWDQRLADHLKRQILRTPRKGEPKVIAVFSFHHDAHLVDGLIANISPSIHGFVCFDERHADDISSTQAEQQAALYRAAEEMGADWIFAVAPDERFEDALADTMQCLTTKQGPVVWTMTCREMFNETQYRFDGLWGNRRRQKLFPCHPGMEPAALPRHANPTKNGPKLPIKRSKIEFFRLRFANPKRRSLQRRVSATADPARAFQDIGYDYIDDDRGMRLRTVSPAHKFTPEHRDDGGLWAVDTALSGACDVSPDPIAHTARRIVHARGRLGFENAMHVAQDLAAERPDDCELALLAAETALLAGVPDVALKICLPILQRQSEPLFALTLIAEAYLDQEDVSGAQSTIETIDRLCPEFDVSRDLKARLAKKSSADAQSGDAALWRRWLKPEDNRFAHIRSGSHIPDAKIAVVVFNVGADARLSASLEALRAQSVPCEIVVVNANGGAAQDVLDAHLDVIRIVEVKHPMSAGVARNIGIDASVANFVAFVTTDSVPVKGWLERCLQAHQDGYAACSTDIAPQQGVADLKLAAWGWVHGARSDSGDTSEKLDGNVSYDRQIFRQFGYFPTDAGAGEYCTWNDRHLAQIDVARNGTDPLMCCFRDDPAEIEEDIQTFAIQSTCWPEQRTLLTPHAIRSKAKTLTTERLDFARAAVVELQGHVKQKADVIERAFRRFADLQEQQIVQTGLNIHKAMQLKAQAEAVLSKDADMACAFMAEAVALWPEASHMLMYAARCRYRSSAPGRQRLAVELALEAFSRNPDMVEAVSMAVQWLVKDKHFQDAFDVFRSAVALNPGSIETLMLVRFLPGPRFRSIRAMYFQKAFILAPWAPPPNNQLITYYNQTADAAASMGRKSTFDLFLSP